MGVKLGTSGVDLRLGTATPATVRLGSSHIWSPPMAVPGLHSWWDFADAGTMTLNGGNISQIADKSGNGRHMTQGTAAAQPALTANAQNGRSAATFTGTQYLLGASAADWKFLHYGADKYAVFVVMKASSSPDPSYGVLGTANGPEYDNGLRISASYNSSTPAMSGIDADILATNTYSGYLAGPELYPFDATQALVVEALGDPSAADPEDALLLTTRRTGTTVDGYPYGEEGEVATDGPAASALAIGAAVGPGGGGFYGQGAKFNGIICEVLIYRRSTALTAGEKTAINNYLFARWGL